jgi:uncharacterized protein (TIGR02594 family)
MTISPLQRSASCVSTNATVAGAERAVYATPEKRAEEMMLSRRTLMAGMSALWAARAPAKAQVPQFIELLEPPPVPPQYRSLADEPVMNQEFGNELTPQGTQQPSPEENEIARNIIAELEAFGNLRPFEIAAFFLDVARGIHGESWRPYTRAWPIDAHANPVIVEFFRATTTRPLGDRTAWCAAFVNWCLLKAHGRTRVAPTTGSAASASFRRWGTTVATYDTASSSTIMSQDPKVGDLVVFQEMMTDGRVSIFGHVGFFIDMDEKRVRVLGGNQFEGSPVVHAINVKWLPKDSSLMLHSIRTHSFLS